MTSPEEARAAAGTPIPPDRPRRRGGRTSRDLGRRPRPTAPRPVRAVAADRDLAAGRGGRRHRHARSRGGRAGARRRGRAGRDRAAARGRGGHGGGLSRAAGGGRAPTASRARTVAGWRVVFQNRLLAENRRRADRVPGDPPRDRQVARRRAPGRRRGGVQPVGGRGVPARAAGARGGHRPVARGMRVAAVEAEAVPGAVTDNLQRAAERVARARASRSCSRRHS